MSDVMPNYKVEQQRLRSQIADQEASIAKQTLAIMEMADRKVRHEENITAAESTITEYRKRLSELEETHGKLTGSEIADMGKSLGS